MQTLPVQEFLKRGATTPFVDVRTPAEFEKGHIPGAINLPLFTNEERAIIGTLYKQRGKDAAIMKGLEFVGPRMANTAKKAQKIAKGGTILVHCWRGGMRSQSMAQLFQMIGLKAQVLTGGYKAFRGELMRKMAEPTNLLVLDGKTGSGKTEVLLELKKLGEQVIDLEGLAHHKGSAFGNLGQKPQPATEHFHNLLYQELMQMDSSKPIWLEAESICIGSVHIPEQFFNQMKLARGITLEVPIEERINRLLKEYAHFTDEDCRVSLKKIEKRLGGEAYKQCLKLIETKEYATIAQMTLLYYDKAYGYGAKEREKHQTFIAPKDDPIGTAIALQKMKNS